MVFLDKIPLNNHISMIDHQFHTKKQKNGTETAKNRWNLKIASQKRCFLCDRKCQIFKKIDFLVRNQVKVVLFH